MYIAFTDKVEWNCHFLGSGRNWYKISNLIIFFLCSVGKILQYKTVSQTVPAGSWKVTVVFNFFSENTVLIYGF